MKQLCSQCGNKVSRTLNMCPHCYPPVSSVAPTILKTKFYPVNIDAKTIVNDPMRREVDVARKYGCKIIGMPGRRILQHACYTSYKWEAA